MGATSKEIGNVGTYAAFGVVKREQGSEKAGGVKCKRWRNRAKAGGGGLGQDRRRLVGDRDDGVEGLGIDLLDRNAILLLGMLLHEEGPYGAA